MSKEFSKDVVPLSKLEADPGKVIARIQKTRRPTLLTSGGRGVAVVQSVEGSKRSLEELRFVKAVALGLMDAAAGNAVSLKEARDALGLK